MLACDCTQFGALGLPSDTHAIVPAWQTDPRALRAMVAASSRPRFGALAADAAGAAGGAAKGASAGASVAGPWGAAIGAVLGAALGLLHKQYFNVSQSNADCAQVLNLWNQYLQIQGHVSGRALGVKEMQVIFHGAVGAGLFPGNDMHLSFHGGTLQCAGHGDWVDEFLGNTLQGGSVGCGAHNCMPDAVNAFQQQRGSKPASTPDAVFLIDSILLPMNQSAKIPWIYNGAEQHPEVHQLFYDLADAYLGEVAGTTPYVEYPQPPPVAIVAPPPTPMQAVPTAIPKPLTTAATPQPPPTPIPTYPQLIAIPGTPPASSAVPAAASTPSSVSYVPNESGGGVVYAPPVEQPVAAPPGTTAAISTGGIGSTGLLIGLGVVGLWFLTRRRG